MFKTIEQIHFVGIGGSGMSGIAEVLLNLGYRVTGSDLKKSEVTERLEELGAKIFYGHAARNAEGAHVVVTSTAVEKTNPETLYAREKKVPVIPRIEMLAEIARLKYTIAVGGTHGKTTTTSMIACILQEGGLDPTFIVGGRIRHLGSGARLGQGEFLVAEADESDGSFLKLSPAIAVITNVDNDHLDYHKSLAKLRGAFVQFGNRIPFYGCAIVCADDPGVQSILPRLARRVVTYGSDRNCDFSYEGVTTHPEGLEYALLRQGRAVGRVNLALSGRHNLLNSIAACACGLELGISFDKIASCLARFESVGRRLEKRGEKGGAVWVDDYGHHPTEIRATLQALKERYPDRRLLVCFQPHRFSRTKLLLKEFSQSFNLADEVVLLPIYPAGEKPVPGVDSGKLLALLKRGGVSASLDSGRAAGIRAKVRPGTVFLTLGAGDVWKVGEELFS